MTTETTPPTRSGFNHIVAFEVAKAELVVHCLPAGTSTRLANTPTAIRRLLKGEARRSSKHRLGNLLVVCGATGGYERALIAEAASLDLPCHRAHGSAVRAYARFSGTHGPSPIPSMPACWPATVATRRTCGCIARRARSRRPCASSRPGAPISSR